MAEQTTKSIIVRARVKVAFHVWALDNFPSFMANIKSVDKRPDGSSHWTMDGPIGKTVQWDAQMTTFEPGKRIAWRSREGSGTPIGGQATFAELETGQTQVTLTVQWIIPTPKGGEMLAGPFTNPGKRMEEDLNNFKAFVEGRERGHVEPRDSSVAASDL